jgi:hypothetical protein
LGASNADSKGTIRISAYPNPTNDFVIIELLDDSNEKEVQKFQLFDATGRVVRQATFTGNRYEWQCNGLNAGFYWFQVERAGQRIGTGRIVIQ